MIILKWLAIAVIVGAALSQVSRVESESGQVHGRNINNSGSNY